jgi:hypothetical protein
MPDLLLDHSDLLRVAAVGVIEGDFNRRKLTIKGAADGGFGQRMSGAVGLVPLSVARAGGELKPPARYIPSTL